MDPNPPEQICVKTEVVCKTKSSRLHPGFLNDKMSKGPLRLGLPGAGISLSGLPSHGRRELCMLVNSYTRERINLECFF